MVDFDKVWTIKQLAEEAGVTRQYINQLVLEKKIKAQQLPSRAWLIPESEARKFLEQRKD
jgi:excisionase family DNA binding protein